MKCFYHRDRDAVGLCKACEKGLCPECAVDLGKGLACRGRCEEFATALIAMLERDPEYSTMIGTHMRGTRHAAMRGSALFAAIGVALVGWSVRYWPSYELVTLMGGIVAVYGMTNWVSAWRMPAPAVDSPAGPVG